mgnify:CR=1 FL=1
MERLQVLTNDSLKNHVVIVERFPDGTCIIENLKPVKVYNNINELLAMYGKPENFKVREI